MIFPIASQIYLTINLYFPNFLVSLKNKITSTRVSHGVRLLRNLFYSTSSPDTPHCPLLIRFEPGSRTFEMIDSSFILFFEFLELINDLLTNNRLPLADEQDLSELVVKMFRKKIHPTTFAKLVLNPTGQQELTCRGTCLDIAHLAILLPVVEAESPDSTISSESQDSTLVDMMKLP